ncbi:NifU family protein [Alkalicaulis satelles]|uniref:NifU family protein n=1 Tax=Alkalicaulis satelles TaxID=2609175 RepID=A0A5M6ZJL7_9PROT|nr:NifU family protein [Alkalicaulis satelles]KAA5803934.1 NifU family protein [Alkalicaulis satelles]
MFIQTEPTPNPDTLKFLPGQAISPDTPRDFATAEAAQSSLLARDLFAIEGVAGVFAGEDFVSVTKHEDADWIHIRPAILGVIMDAVQSGRPLFDGAAGTGHAAYEGEAEGIVKEILDVIDTRVRPAVARDGGDIVFHAYDEGSGVVQLHMRGACAGCPSSTYTLKQGIENLLKHYVPEVTAVEAVV